MKTKYLLSNCLKKNFKKLKNKIVIKTKEKQYTYADLYNISKKISFFIEQQKISNDDIIVIISRKDFTTYATIIACILSGKTYAVVDFSLPKERLNKILEKCNPKIIFSSKRDKLKIKKIKIINTKKITKNIKLLNYKLKKIDDDKPCYLMFTSGSTGFPKGAIIRRESLLRFARLCKKNFSLNNKDNLTSLNPLYFDNSIFDIFATILNGLTLTIFTENDLKNPNDILKKVKKFKPTVWFSTPSLLIYLINLKILNYDNFRPIKKIIFGGEAFPINKLKQLFELDKSKFLYNVYGPTETTCICSSHKINKHDIYNTLTGYVTIGKMWDTFNFSLNLNKSKVSLNSKKIGELYLTGQNIGSGYINDYLQTKKNFFGQTKDKKKFIGYKTGDLFVQNSKTKKLYFKGRKDTQIKVMGHRIELSEIEVSMNKINLVEEVVIFSKKTEDTNRIIAVISGKKIKSKEYIYQQSRLKLPPYMIPSNIFLVKKMPKNANGKIDRVKLKGIYEKKTII
jgi:D-alanine--poly(phosphoribitol) ligase subunit 1